MQFHYAFLLFKIFTSILFILWGYSLYKYLRTVIIVRKYSLLRHLRKTYSNTNTGIYTLVYLCILICIMFVTSILFCGAYVIGLIL